MIWFEFFLWFFFEIENICDLLYCKIMKILPFKLERYFAKHEFSAPYLMSGSDCEPLDLKELLSLADKGTLSLWDKLKLGYTESQGNPLLREEVASLYTDVGPENILILAPEEGIFIFMNTILEKNDHLIVTFPGYQSLYEIARSLECQVTRWMPEEKNGWFFDLDVLKSKIKKNTRLIVINFPHNPTGSLLSKEDFSEILEIARKNNIFVFSDEMYRFLEYNPHDRLDSACEKYENAVSLFGLSKTFALAGLRIGWLVTKNTTVLNRFFEFKDYTTICCSAPSEILGLIGVRARDKIIERNLKIIKKNLNLLDVFFKKYTQLFSWNRPSAGTIGFPGLLIQKKVAEFCGDLLSKKGVVLLPSDVYDYKGNHFRVGFGRKNMPRALKLLEDYVKGVCSK